MFLNKNGVAIAFHVRDTSVQESRVGTSSAYDAGTTMAEMSSRGSFSIWGATRTDGPFATDKVYFAGSQLENKP